MNSPELSLSEESVDIRLIAADIARELKDKPETWAKGDFAYDSTGEGVWPDDSRAVCWCIRGHLWKRNKAADTTPYLRQFMDAAGLARFSEYKYDLSAWNDEPGRTVDEVIALCEKVAVS